jgi:lipid-A-disaccharide synthase
MIIVYNVSPGMAFQGYVIHGKPKFIGLPNILLQRMAVPELVHHDLTGPNVASAIRSLLDASAARREQIEAFREIDEITGPPDAITKTAHLALAMLSSPPSSASIG